MRPSFLISLLLVALVAGCGRGQQTPYLPAPTAPRTDFVHGERKVVKARRLNLRQGPSTQARILTVLQRGEPLTVYSRQGGWLRVLTAAGREGWVYGRYVGHADEDNKAPASGWTRKKTESKGTARADAGVSTAHSHTGREMPSPPPGDTVLAGIKGPRPVPTDPEVSIPVDMGEDGESAAPPIGLLEPGGAKEEAPDTYQTIGRKSPVSSIHPVPGNSATGPPLETPSHALKPGPGPSPEKGSKGLATVTRPAPAGRWDALSTMIIPDLLRRQMDIGFLLKRFRSAKCTIHTTVTAPGAKPLQGRLSYYWNDANGDKKLGPGEVRITPTYISSGKMGPYTARLQQMLQASALENLEMVCRSHSITTRKTARGYQMQFIPVRVDKGIKSMQWIVSGDYRIDHVIQHSLDGSRTVIRYRNAKVDGRWLATGFSVDIYGPGGGLMSRRQWEISYKNIHGVPVISELSISGNDPIRKGVVQWSQRCSFRGWRMVPR